MGRRRSRARFDSRLIPLMVGILLFTIAFYSPTFAHLFTIVFALLAVGFWLIGASRRASDIRRWTAVANMYALSPDAFEHHVADTYSAMGYRTRVTKRVGDQGLDVIAERGKERLGIQCKRTTEPTSNSAVQEAYAGKAHYQCTSAAVVALGGFTSSALALASTTGVIVIDGAAYADLVHRAKAATSSRPFWQVFPKRQMALNAAICAISAVVFFGIENASPGRQSDGVNVYTTSPVSRSTPADAIRSFYESISAKEYSKAYALLSPTFKSVDTYASFVAGYKTTENVSVSTSNDSGSVVNVRLVATDRNADGSNRVTRYKGYWSVVSDSSGSWLLDTGHFTKI